MKILCFILSLIVLSLSSAPCCSDDHCTDELKTEHTDNHAQDDKDNDCNACSPFFSCGTCSGFVFSKLGVEFEKIYFIKDKSIHVYKSQFLSEFFAKIWQPPKIS